MAIYGARAFNALKPGLLRDIRNASLLGLAGGLVFWKFPADRQVKEFQRRNNEATEEAHHNARKAFAKHAQGK